MSNKETLYFYIFSQLYVEEHDNVSILYADVVNYTKISTTLSPMRMVELLNELFGRFDEASEVSKLYLPKRQIESHNKTK